MLFFVLFCFDKTMENVRNRIHVRVESNKNEYLKWKSLPSSISLKIFNNELVEIRESKVTLTLKKPA